MPSSIRQKPLQCCQPAIAVPSSSSITLFMSSVPHRADGRASSGVNKKDQYYRDSKLNPSPSKQPAKDLLSSLTPPNHNQARNAVGGASSTNSTGRSKRRSQFAKHDNSKRSRATNVCPGSAVSVSSNNANAAGTGSVEDECDNKENCSPLEESWTTPLKRTLAVLNGCLIPVKARQAVIKLFIDEAQSFNNVVKSAILKWLII